MSIHTPGPWASDEMIHNMMEFRIYSSAGKIIARVQDFTTFREDVEQAEANAALIAAAPDLLSVLKEAVCDGRLQTFEDRERFRKAARIAIAKAEGRG